MVKIDTGDTVFVVNGMLIINAIHHTVPVSVLQYGVVTGQRCHLGGQVYFWVKTGRRRGWWCLPGVGCVKPTKLIELIYG